MPTFELVIDGCLKVYVYSDPLSTFAMVSINLYGVS